MWFPEWIESRSSRAGWLSSLFLIAIAYAQGSSAQQTPSCPPNWTQRECEAVAVVNAWDAAWATGNGEKVGSYMAEDVAYSDGAGWPTKSGRAMFIDSYVNYFKVVKSYDVIYTYAAGDRRGLSLIHI